MSRGRSVRTVVGEGAFGLNVSAGQADFAFATKVGTTYAAFV